MGILDENGFNIKVEACTMKVVKGSMVLMKGLRKNGLYILQAKTVIGQDSSVQDKATARTWLWHRRLGHISDRGLQELEKQGLLGSEKLTKLGFCEDCVMGKSHRVRFGQDIHKTKSVLDYIHSNLWGASRVTSHGRARYFVTFLDDFSRRVWVYILKNKNDAFDTFVKWKARVEIQTERKIKRLRTNNGLEFCAGVFDECCANNDIARHHTIINSPQQNGQAERMNRIIMDRVRCMLNYSCLSKQFWAEVVMTTVYLINKSPCTVIEMKTPMEKWTGEPVNYGNLRIFRCRICTYQRWEVGSKG